MNKLTVLQLDGVNMELLTDVFQSAISNKEARPKQKADYIRLSLDIQNQRNHTLKVFTTDFNRDKIVKAINDGIMYNRNLGRLGIAEIYMSIAKDIDK